MKILMCLLLCWLWVEMGSASFSFNVTDTDMATGAVTLFTDDAKIVMWRWADQILPMHYIATLVNEFEIFIVILIVLLIVLFTCSYYMASFVFNVTLGVITVFIQTLFVFFTLSFFSKTIK